MLILAFTLAQVFDALVAGHGACGDEGLVQSLVETVDDLFQVFTLLDNLLRMAFWPN